MRKRLSKSAVARGVALALAATLTFTSVDITALAAETGIATQASSGTQISGTNLRYTLVNGTLTISGNGNLPNNSFKNRSDIKTVIVKDGVTAIGSFAFNRCSNLVSVTLPGSVKVIYGDAFEDCTSLKTIELKEGLTKIGRYAFYGDTSLRNISIPKSVSVIEYYAFYDNWKNTDVAKKIQQFKALGNDFFDQTYNYGNDIQTLPDVSVKLVGYLDGSTTIRAGEMLEAQIEGYKGKGTIYYSSSSSSTRAFESTDTYLIPDDMLKSASTSGVLANIEYDTNCSIMAYIVENGKVYKTKESTYHLETNSLQTELKNVSVIMTPGESLSMAQILGRAGITHITSCLGGNNISGATITEGNDFATLYNKQITIKENADNKTVKVSYKASTSSCSFHGTDTASNAVITIHILPKLNYKATDKKITINYPQEGYDYYIDNKKGVLEDGKITFSGLTPDTEYVIQTKSQTRGEGQTSEKVKTSAKIDHVWTYTAKDNQISVTCTAEDGCDYKDDGSLTLTLNADDAGYTGAPYTGTATVGDIAVDETGATVSGITYEGRNGTDYESDTAPTDRGTYTAKVTVTDSNGTQYTATKDFEITMGTQTATVNMQDYTYDTPVSTPSLVGAKEDPTVTYYYYPKNGTKEDAKKWEGIDTDTLDPGAYYIYAKISATDNYNGCETDPEEFTVAGKDMESNITASDVDVTYDGEPHGIDVKVDLPAGYSIKYGTEEGEYILDKSPEYTDVVTDEDGQVIANTVYYEVTARGYNTVTGSATVKINPLEAELKWDNTKLTYNGTAQAPTATVTNLKSQGETKDECTVTVEGAQTNAGNNYTATATALSNKNYVLSTDGSKIKTEFNIAKKEIGINWADLSFTYDGHAHVPTATATDVVAGDTCDITVSGDKTNAGTYTATASISNNNYELPAEHTKSFTIDPKALTADMISLDSNVSEKNNTYLFTGNEITPRVTVSDGTDKLLAAGEDKDYVLSGDTKATKYGEHTLKVEGKNNYTGTIIVTWNIDEDKAPTGTIAVGKNSWNSFWNTVTFGHFFKKTATVTVSAADGENESGVDKVYYVVSDDVYSNEADVAAIDADKWTEIENGGSFDIEPNAKKYVYVKITDKAGNTSYINSDGIVVYTDAKAITESLTYTKTTNEDKTAEVTLKGNTIKEVRNGDNFLTKGTDYTLSEDGSKVTFKGEYLQSLGAGEYTITVSYNPLGEAYKTDIVDGADANEAPQATSIALKVVKAEGSVTGISDISKVYDAKEVAAPEFTTTNTRGDGDSNVSITYKAKGADDSTFTAEAPKNAGDYVVRVSAAADENYNAATAEKEFTISPKVVTAVVTAKNKIYDGNADAVVSATVDTDIRGESLTIAGLSGKFDDANAGTDKEVTPVSDFATVTAGENTIAGNYSVLYPQTKADIKPKTIGITWGDNEFVYNGQPQAPTAAATGLIGADKCDIIVDGARTDVGTKTVKATGVSNSNYVLPDDDSIWNAVSVAKADSVYTAEAEANELTYNGDRQELVSKAESADGKVMYRLGEDGEWSTEVPAAKNAEEYTVYYKVAGDKNHNDSEVKSVKVNIKKKTVTATITPNGGTYADTITAADVKLNGTVEGEDPGVKLTYTGTANDGTEVNSTDVPEKAGSYKVTATISDSNYELTGTVDAEFTVKKVDHKLTVTKETYDAAYGDVDFNIGASSADSETSIRYVSSNPDVATVDENGNVSIKGAGSATITVTMDESANYTGVTTKTTINVAKKAVTVTANDATKHVTTADPALGYTVTGLVGKDTLDDVTVTREEGENVSTAGKYYRITATADADSYPNYDITFVDGKFTITDHTWSDWKEILAPTATANGKKESVCSICGHSRYENIPATGLPAEEDPTDGKFEKDVQVAPDSPIKEATMTNSSSALLEASNIFTKEEKALINDKKVDSKVWLEITNTDISKLSEETKKSILEKAASIMGKDVTEDDIMFFDADLFKQVIDAESGEAVTEKTAISEPGENIDVTIKIPDELLMDPAVKSMVRVYKIIRIHTDETTGEQTVDVIDGNFDEATGEFSFTTDKFSTYAIAFTEVPLEVSIAADESSATDGTKLDDGKVEMTKKGDTIKFTATVTPDSASKRKVTWTSSNPSVATVDENGVVTAVANGTTTITATVADGGAIAEYTVSVNIPKKQETVKPANKPTNKPADKTATGSNSTITKPSADKPATAKQNAKTTTTKAKKTGDNNTTALWLVLMLGGCAIVAFGRKRKYNI